MQELWGVSARLAKRMQDIENVTSSQLARAKRTLLRQKFGVGVELMAMELSGTSCLALEEITSDRKNICCSRSFGRPVESLDELAEAVAMHASRAGEKQASLFRSVDPEREAKERRLMEAADKLNLWYGRGTVRAATAGVRQDWQMRRERLSPCYTTRLEDVPRATL